MGEKKKGGKKSKGSKKKKKGTTATTVTVAPPAAKSLMELLELEYRAKAIKALLRQQGVTGVDIDDAIGTGNAVVPPDSPKNPIPAPPAKVNNLTRAGHQQQGKLTTTTKVESLPKPKKNAESATKTVKKPVSK